jgi:hypothetical protein
MPANTIHTCPELLGFWAFALGDAIAVGVLETDAQGRRSALTTLRVTASGSVQPLRRIEADDASIHAADARVIGADLVFALEVNRRHALQLVRLPLAGLLDTALPTATAPPVFQPIGSLDLSPVQQTAVRLPASEQWNVADTLAPKRWLFSPRLVLGTAGPEVIANSADGQAMVLAPAPAERPPPLEGAAEPQALVQPAGDRITAYLRHDSPYRPYDSLARYSGLAQPEPGMLWVADSSGANVSRSAQLGLGAVIAYSLAAGNDGNPWIFALRDQGGGTALSALSRRTGRWIRMHEVTLDSPAQAVVAIQAGTAWHWILATRTEQGWSLRHKR